MDIALNIDFVQIDANYTHLKLSICRIFNTIVQGAMISSTMYIFVSDSDKIRVVSLKYMQTRGVWKVLIFHCYKSILDIDTKPSTVV